MDSVSSLYCFPIVSMSAAGPWIRQLLTRAPSSASSVVFENGILPRSRAERQPTAKAVGNQACAAELPLSMQMEGNLDVCKHGHRFSVLHPWFELPLPHRPNSLLIKSEAEFLHDPNVCRCSIATDYEP